MCTLSVTELTFIRYALNQMEPEWLNKLGSWIT